MEQEQEQIRQQELNKYFASETRELMRSEIRLSDYNPRRISEEGRRQLRRSIKTYGVVGGIVVNSRTGNTVVGGHQKVAILDELNGFPEKDYLLKVELVDLDGKTEKQLNIVLNNPNVGGEWDFDALSRLVPEIDYKAAGLTAEDLSMIGCDYMLRTEGEEDIAKAMDALAAPERELSEEEKQRRREEREREREARTDHMKDVKREVREGASGKADDMDAYVTLSFDGPQAKAAFMRRFGYDPRQKFIKGEDFSSKVERVWND